MKLSHLILSAICFTLWVDAASALDFEKGERAQLLSEPRRWVSTDSGNSLEKNPFLFLFRKRARRVATDSEQVNIHSHYRGKGGRLRNFIYTGLMKIRDEDGGIGVTFLSDYPREDTYYRLRRFSGSPSFHIAPHGTEITSGETDSGVTPQAGKWYRFKVRVRVTRSATRIWAKVWKKNRKQPRQWQIDCRDSSDTRLRRGRAGIWSMGSDVKSWRRLAVKPR